MYLGLRGVDDRLSHHTISISNDYARNMRELRHKHVLSEDPSSYVQNASVTDSILAPRGKSTPYVLVPVTHESSHVDSARERARYRELILDKLAGIGVTDIRSRIEYERIVTPADWHSSFEIYKGAVFGWRIPGRKCCTCGLAIVSAKWNICTSLAAARIRLAGCLSFSNRLGSAPGFCWKIWVFRFPGQIKVPNRSTPALYEVRGT